MQENKLISLQIAEKVKQLGGNTFYVGGYVRDQILKMEKNISDNSVRYNDITYIIEEENTSSLSIAPKENQCESIDKLSIDTKETPCKSIDISIDTAENQCNSIEKKSIDTAVDAPEDIDIEIHGILPEQLLPILDEFGERIEVGSDYGVYGIRDYDIDIALPRTEKAVGKGHKDFEVIVHPFLGTKKAAMRRDFTINALMCDVLTGEIVDHFHGMEDLENRVIRHVNGVTFAEDPLRLFRGAQFAARFACEVAEETLALCRKMDVTTLVGDRVYKEMKKALLKAEKPSIFFEELRKMNQLSVWFPEVEHLIGVEQNPKYHKEGDVWTHTMMVVDEAAKYRDKTEHPMEFMLSALTHDFGKIVATEYVKGELHAYEHEKKGVSLAEQFLGRLTTENQVIRYVLNMVENHMKPHAAARNQSSIKKTNKMFDQSVAPRDLIFLACADVHSTINDAPYVEHEDFLLERLAIYQEMMDRPHVMGRDLIEAGLKPGADFSEILSYAHKLRLAGIPKENALKQTLAYGEKMRKRNHSQKMNNEN